MNEDLGSHILRCSDKAKGLILILHHFFTCTHINQLQITILADHNILRLQITIYDVFHMESFQDMDEESNVEPGLFERQNANASDHIEEIFSLNVLGKEVDVEVVFEGTVVFHKEGGVLQTDQIQSLLLFLNNNHSTFMKDMCFCFVKGFLEMHFKAKCKFYF